MFLTHSTFIDVLTITLLSDQESNTDSENIFYITMCQYFKLFSFRLAVQRLCNVKLMLHVYTRTWCCSYRSIVC